MFGLHLQYKTEQRQNMYVSLTHSATIPPEALSFNQECVFVNCLLKYCLKTQRQRC